MEQIIEAFKNILILPISNPSGLITNIHAHFFIEGESTRIERDSRTVNVIKFHMARLVH